MKKFIDPNKYLNFEEENKSPEGKQRERPNKKLENL
jgi:hypothetical protein